MGSKPIFADQQEEESSGRQKIGWSGGRLRRPDDRTPSSPPKHTRHANNSATNCIACLFIFIVYSINVGNLS